ncbi:hypothetical protein G5I_00114 [Acromyrmex echinatior]|uniref:Uncharacterized protein n=1 Tax=Acromyrmex echinatior TaxID=103372 RepID=F4W409_ACREC|nr:hypothetical protein G5I_00114 [Acromyrmex echinatior]
MGFPIRSITTDSFKREIGSNRENEFRRVVAVTRSFSLTTSYEGECNGKRDSKSLGYTSRQAIPCCYLALSEKEQLFSTRSAPWHYGSGMKIPIPESTPRDTFSDFGTLGIERRSCDRCGFVRACRRDAMSCDRGRIADVAMEAKERDSREDTLGGFSGVRGRKSRRAFHNERSSQYVVTRRLTLPQPRARRVDNRFREGTTATVLVLPPLWMMFERRRHSGNQVDSQSVHFPHRDRSPTSPHKGNLLFHALKHSRVRDKIRGARKSALALLSSVFESGVDRAARLALEMLISNANKMTCSRKIASCRTIFEKVTLVFLLLTLLSITKVEGWNTTGLVSLTLIIVVIIKLFGIAIAYSDLVDMSGDWSYLIEFGFGVILIVIVVGIELFVIMHTLHTVAVFAAVFGTFLSSVSLMDLHQNMSINSWWWEKKLINGCMYHVFRQYTLLWCLRIEEKPRLITIFDSAPNEQETC